MGVQDGNGYDQRELVIQHGSQGGDEHSTGQQTEIKHVKVNDATTLKRLLSDHFRLDATGHGPCPVCGGEDRFFIILDEREGYPRIRFSCRQADIHNHQRLWGVEALFRKFTNVRVVSDDWGIVAEDYHLAHKSSRSRFYGKPLSHYVINIYDVVKFHFRGVELWRQRYKYSDWALNEFMLGVMVDRGHERFLIPLPMDDQGIYFIPKTRAFNDDERPKYLMPPNVSPMLYKFGGTKPGFTTKEGEVFICEGEKSLIALADMGFSPLVTTTAGAAAWRHEWSQQLLKQGVRVFNFIPDNDNAGQQFVVRVSKSIVKVASSAGIAFDELVFRVARWPEGTEPKYDPYDVLHNKGADEGREFILGMFDGSEVDPFSYARDTVERGRFLKGYYKDHEWETPQTLDEVRKEMWGVVNDFVDNYRKRHYHKGNAFYNEEPRGSALFIKAPPGVGKTHLLVRLAERVALEQAEKAKIKDSERAAALYSRLQDLGFEHPEWAYARFEHRDELIEFLKNWQRDQLRQVGVDEARRKKTFSVVRSTLRLIAPYKRLAVAFVGPFRRGFDDVVALAEHPDLWVNIEARNGNNCKNFPLSQMVAKRGYSVMETLCTREAACPFQKQCKENGYLAQFDQLPQYPIVYLRHQHLRSKTILDNVKLVIVDEDSIGEYTKSFALTADDLQITDDLAVVVEDKERRDALDALVAALRVVIEGTKFIRSINTTEVISGYDALNILDTVLMRTAALSLADVDRLIDDDTISALMDYIPDELSNSDAIRRKGNRHVMTLITYILDEARTFYFRGVVEWNSRVHFYNRTWRVFPMQPISIEPKIPLIILDATGLKSEYRKAYDNRNIVVYEPAVRNPNTRTFAVINTEFTRTALTRGLRTSAEDAVAEGFALVERSGLGDTMEKAYYNRLTSKARKPFPNKDLQQLTQLVAYLAMKHDDLLVITHRPVRYWFEERFFEEFPKWRGRVVFDHYQATRGTNIYKDYHAVAVIGTPRPPSAIMYMLLQAMYYGDYSPILNIMDRVPEPYHNTSDGYLTRTFQPTYDGDVRALELFDKIEAGELEQSAGRIRPHTSEEPKTVYYLTARPAGKWITDIVSIQDLIWEATQMPRKVVELHRHVSKHNLGADVGIRVVKSVLKLGQKRATMVRDKYARLIENDELGQYLRSKGLDV